MAESAVRPSYVLTDNWTLQCVGTLLSGGLAGGNASEIEISDDLSAFGYKRTSLDALNTRCLFQTLNHLVFTDRLYVDEDSASAWTHFDVLSPLSDGTIVFPKPFRDIRREWLPIRQRFVEELCASPAMLALHEENVRSFKATGESKDPYFGQLIWGGAGMLARAHFLEIPYSGHPAREAWFGRVSSLFGRRSAETRFEAFLSEQRAKVFRRIDSGGYLAELNLPPVAAIIIQEARTPADLLKVALQVRDEYAPLRGWLRDFQAALDGDDTKDQLTRERLLQSVARNIGACCSATPVGDTTVQIGLSWLKTTLKVGDPLNRVQNLIGVRALMNRLVLAPAGAKTIRKLARLFGEDRSALGRDLEQALRHA